MGIRYFQGEKIRYEHEYQQIREIVELLRPEFEKEPVYVLTNILVANKQIDCVLLTRSGPLILELKAFSGEVHGHENGGWEVVTRDGPIPIPNLFTQAKTQRQDFIDRLIPIYREHLPHISQNSLRKIGAWVYFSRESMYPEGQIDLRRVKWFRVVTADTLLDAMRFPESGYSLRIQDMDAIVAGLHLQEYAFGTDQPVSPAPPDREPRFRVSRRGVVAISLIAVILCVIAILLLVPDVREAIVSGINSIVLLLGGLISEGSRDLIKSGSTPDDSRDGVMYLNRIRIAAGVAPVSFDERAYQVALWRAGDMAEFRYLDYINPVTGSSAHLVKSAYGFLPEENLIESAYGQWSGYRLGIEHQAIDAWVSDHGNRALLLSNVSGGAIACTHGYCSFIGVAPAEAPGPAEPILVEEDDSAAPR